MSQTFAKKKEEKWIDSSKRLSVHSKTYIQQEHGWSTVLTHDLTAEIPSRPSLDMFFTTWCSKKMTFVSVWFSVCTLKVPLQHLHLWELCIFLKIPDCFNTQISYWNWGLMFCDRSDSCQRRKNRSIRKTLSVNAASVSSQSYSVITMLTIRNTFVILLSTTSSDTHLW